MRNAGLTPVFHPWRLHLALTNPFLGQVLKPGPPVLVSSSDKKKAHEEWKVLEVVDSQKTKKYGVQYKATCMGNWEEWNLNPAWQPYSDFENAREKIREFHKTHPQKPGLPSKLVL